MKKYFSIEEFAKYNRVSIPRAYSILRENLKKGKMVKIASNLYKFSEKRTLPKLNRDLESIRKRLWNKGFNFSFTGMSVLEKYIHHIPYSMIYHVYAEKGSGEPIKAEIKEKDTALLLNPTYDEIIVVVEEGRMNKIIVIIENNYLGLSNEGIASYEKAFVDLYYETTRNKTPFMEPELYYIAEALIAHDEINFSRMFTYAKIRGIFSELRKFFKKLSETITIPTEVRRRYGC
ncbi:MAG: hypothetical protein DRJ64_08070 [Thermoprotei archaeon]|nr:MAG: hypothetical protein DRJ64_08070 [Thermoprotei archaeon]